MPFQQWPLPKRRDQIRELRADGTTAGKYPLDFQGQVQYFYVFIVDIEFPSYRLANGRTQAAQREYIANQGLPEDFFSADVDSAPALEAQHEILREMAKDAGLFEILKKNKQDQPLILDKDGYIINGNRRLCVMRMLLEEDTAQYAHFRRVQVVILPPCSQRDIDELEARLQIRPEGRAEYSWVNRAMMLRIRRQHQWTDEQLADLYDMRPIDIRNQIAMLEDAEQYLEERGQKGHYSLVTRKEYAFRQLQKGRAKCGNDEAKKQLFTNISYIMLDDADTAGGRLYESIPDALQFMDSVADQIGKDFASDLAALSQSADSKDGFEILGQDRQSNFAALVQFLRDTKNSDRTRETVRDKIEEMRNQEREQRDANYCLKQAQQAFTKLQNIYVALDDNSITEGMETLLNSIEKVIVAIRAHL